MIYFVVVVQLSSTADAFLKLQKLQYKIPFETNREVEDFT